MNWFPQVMIDKHQMGSGSIRYYVPPACDPIAENIDAGIWAWTGVFGTNMLKDLTMAGLAGVGQKTIFDDYWPGSTQTSNWKGVISMLTEAASVRDASPVYIEPNVFYEGAQLFNTRMPGFDMDRRVIAKFNKKDLLISGYTEKEERLSEKPAMLWVRKGKGQLVLYSFSPTQGTFKLVFNALLLTPDEAIRRVRPPLP